MVDLEGTIVADPREALRRTVADLAALTARRDQQIRAAVAYGIRVTEIAADAGVTPARVYQIARERPPDTVGSLRATLAAADADRWDGWKNDEA